MQFRRLSPILLLQHVTQYWEGSPTNVEHHTIRRDNLAWHVVTAGPDDAPPLLFLHCWAGNWTLWRSTMERLSAHFRCIAPDQLGFGQSDKPQGDHYRIPAQAERARCILKHFGCERAHVMGHSMGGQIALTLAAHYPHLVGRLVVVAPVVTGSLHPVAWPLLLFPMLVRQGIELPYLWTNRLGRRFPAIGIQMMRSFFPCPKKQPVEALYWLGQMEADGQLHSAAWAQKAAATWNTRPLLKNIMAPTLVIWGLKDWLTPVRHGSILENMIADCRTTFVPDVGHFPMIEAFGAYMAATEKFLLRE